MAISLNPRLFAENLDGTLPSRSDRELVAFSLQSEKATVPEAAIRWSRLGSRGYHDSHGRRSRRPHRPGRETIRG